MKMQKNERGITLVALVVTIVVLLILAGVTIMYVMSDNGVFKTASEAGTKSDQAAVEEAVSTALISLYPEIYSATPDEHGNIDLTAKFTANMPSTAMKMTANSFAVMAEPSKVETLKFVAAGNTTAAGTATAITISVEYKKKPYTVTYDRTNTETGTAGVTAELTPGGADESGAG